MRTPGQNGVTRTRLRHQHERLFIDEIDDAVILAKHTEEYRIEYNTIRPHEALAWNRPTEINLDLANPKIPTFQTEKICQLLDAGRAVALVVQRQCIG